MVSGPTRGVVVVTGASSGIGAACARHLDALGFSVLAGVRRAADGERLREAAGARVLPVSLDVTDPDSLRKLAQEVDRRGEGALAGLVNNAGVALWGPLEHVDLAAFRQLLEVNLVGQVATTQALLPALRRGRGRIVNMGSISGLVALPYLGPYAASKFALEAISDALRLELRHSQVQVCVVEAGMVATPIWRKFLDSFDRVAGTLGEDGRRLYGEDLERLRRRVTAAQGLDPIAVARVVEHALTSRRPRIRYRVGRDAARQARLRWLPDALRDRLVARRLGR